MTCTKSNLNLVKATVSLLFVCLATFAKSQDKTIQKGLYLSYQEFIDDAPKGTDQFYIETSPRSGSNWEGTDAITIRLNESDRKITNIWGFSDGASAFIKHQSDFFPLEAKDDSIFFYGYGTVTKNDWYTGEYQKSIDAKRAKANAIDRAKLEKHKYVLISENGSIERVPTKAELEELAANSMEIIIYRLSKKQKDSTFIITVNDANPTRCDRNSVHSYLISPDMNGATICLNDDDHTCLDIPFNENEPQYIEVSLTTNETSAQLKHAKQEEGEWNAEQIQGVLRKEK